CQPCPAGSTTRTCGSRSPPPTSRPRRPSASTARCATPASRAPWTGASRGASGAASWCSPARSSPSSAPAGAPASTPSRS
ncbi:MAG: Transcriptional regulator, WhiB family, partial [uncultured Quadrisphaera sp.]